MFTPGTLIFFNPFPFTDGSAKPKYFLVLAKMNGEVIVASLPSSQNHLPASQHQQYGCLDDAESGISAFVIEAGQAITKDGWSFEKDTFLYGFWLADFEQGKLETSLAEQQATHKIVGILAPDLLNAILHCFAHSAVVKKKYTRVLQSAIS